jgi:hypothetical protein
MAAVTTERLMEMALEMAGWTNTPPDSAIYWPGSRISHILLGIDVETAELFMARQLGYHCVIAHRPAGYLGPVATLYHQHVAQMEEAGVPSAVAEAAVASRIEQLEASALLENYDHVPSVARLLEMPLLSILSPLEHLGRLILNSKVDEAKVSNSVLSIAQLRDAFLSLPEYAAALVPPRLVLGDWAAPAGRIVVSHGAGSPPTAAIVRAYLSHGVDTLVLSGLPGEEFRELVAEGGLSGSILALGASATASLGLNPYIARLRADGLEVTTFGGIIAGAQPS